MPRPRARPLFELAGQWLAQEPGRPGFYRYWNDPGTGRTRRASLSTTDLEDAKAKLAEIVIRGAPATIDVHLSIILEKYFTEKTDHLPSKKPARHAGKLLLECWGELAKVSGLDLKRFVEWSVKKGHSLNYVARNFSVLAAAMAHSDLRHDIPMKEGVILDRWPHVKAKPKRKVYEPTDEELANVLRQDMPENLRRWLMNSMATLGRPMAVAELRPAQRDRAHGLITLNPEGRRQNKKFRPAVKEPKTMTAWLNQWEKPKKKGSKPMPADQRYSLYAGRSSIHTVLRRACAEDAANVPRFALYSIRHRGTTVLRNAKVPKEQIDYQLGHIQEGSRSTQDYGQYGPDYLADATRALNAWISRILKLAAKKPKAKTRKAA